MIVSFLCIVSFFFLSPYFPTRAFEFLLFCLPILAFSPGSLWAPSEPLCSSSSPCSLMLLLSVCLVYLLPQQDPLKQHQALSYLHGGAGGGLSAGMTSLANLLASVIKSPFLRFMTSDACRRENTYSSWNCKECQAPRQEENTPKFLTGRLLANVACVFFSSSFSFFFFIIQVLQVFKWPIQMFFGALWYQFM